MVANAPNKVTAYFNDYKISAEFEGVTPSPFDKMDLNCNAITVVNTLTNVQACIPIWRPRIVNEDEVLYAFFCLLQGTMMGALEPQAFCHFMGIPEDHPDAEHYFLFFRTTAAKMTPINNDRDELALTMKMLAQKLGVKLNEVKG
jgi:hypothetical protein